jgi:hypothetical protein
MFGAIDQAWVGDALRVNADRVAWLLWQQALLLGRTDNLPLIGNEFLQIGVDAKRDQLNRLERAERVEVVRNPGWAPRVTMLGLRFKEAPSRKQHSQPRPVDLAAELARSDAILKDAFSD